uniref:Uncharacterized protein n=1 Tax=Cyprinodon variegatus TaxID=28743 RepID=A0A3Q2CML5_CYPVA
QDAFLCNKVMLSIYLFICLFFHHNLSTYFLGIIQIIVEKLVDVEFACPCDAITNGYTILFFIAPPFIVVLLMFAYKLKSKSCESCTSGKCLLEALKSATFPAIIWLVIVLLDGCYLACFWTNWSGKYEMIENAAPQRWCKPANSSEILLAKTQLWYSQSQVRNND